MEYHYCCRGRGHSHLYSLMQKVGAAEVIGAQVLARRCAFSERPRSSQWQAANIGAGVIRRGEAGL
jgi:hypothetical protein